MTPRDLKQPGDVMGGAKCTARTARAKTPLPYTTRAGDASSHKKENNSP